MTKAAAPAGRRMNAMEGRPGGLELVDIVAMLRDSDLSPDDRRHVYDAITNGMLSGWNPTRDAVTDLVDVVAGRITDDEFKARVIAAAAARGRESNPRR